MENVNRELLLRKRRHEELENLIELEKLKVSSLENKLSLHKKRLETLQTEQRGLPRTIEVFRGSSCPIVPEAPETVLEFVVDKINVEGGARVHFRNNLSNSVSGGGGGDGLGLVLTDACLIDLYVLNLPHSQKTPVVTFEQRGTMKEGYPFGTLHVSGTLCFDKNQKENVEYQKQKTKSLANCERLLSEAKLVYKHVATIAFIGFRMQTLSSFIIEVTDMSQATICPTVSLGHFFDKHGTLRLTASDYSQIILDGDNKNSCTKQDVVEELYAVGLNHSLVHIERPLDVAYGVKQLWFRDESRFKGRVRDLHYEPNVRLIQGHPEVCILAWPDNLQ